MIEVVFSNNSLFPLTAMTDMRQTILDAMRFRFACKVFNPNRPVSDDDFRCILETARLSPSSFGFEPWRILVIEDKELREAIRSVSWGAQTQLPSCSRFIVLLARKPEAMTPTSDYIQRTIMQETQHQPEDLQKARTQKYDTFLKTDFAYVDNQRAKFEWACRQCYIALGNMFTAAALIGIDSCPCEGFQKEPLEKLLTERGLLNGNEYGVACMAAFGYRKEPPHREKTRRPMEQVVRWI